MTINLKTRHLILLLTFTALGPLVSAQAEWSRFRGPSGSGVAADDQPLPVHFGTEQGLLWKTEVGAGHASPCVYGDRIFIPGMRDGELETLCIERSSGEVLWGRTIPLAKPEHQHKENSQATPTATSDGQSVFVYFGSFGLLCYDMLGEELWRREMKPLRNIFGTASSPIMAGGMLVLLRDTNEDSRLEAMDPKTGKTVWSVDRVGFDSGWSTPVVRQVEGVQELVVFGKWWLTGYDLRDGSERWAVPGLSDEPIVTPAMGEGLIYVSSYNMNTNTEVLGLPDWELLLKECDTDGDGRLTRPAAAWH